MVIFTTSRTPQHVVLFVVFSLVVIFTTCAFLSGVWSKVKADETAVHPSWRTAIQHIVLVASWGSTRPFCGLVREYLTNQPRIMGSIAPGYGSYQNECLVPFLAILIWSWPPFSLTELTTHSLMRGSLSWDPAGQL